MKRMSIGQTLIQACLTLLLFFVMLKDLSTFAVRFPDLSRQAQRLAAYLPASARMPLLGLILAIVGITLVLLFFLLSGKAISLVLRIAGKDPVNQYHAYNRFCRKKMGDTGNRLQLEQPAFRSVRIRKFCVRAALILLCLFIFFLVVFRVIGTSRRVLAGVILGLLAALGLLLAYFLLWMIVKTVTGRMIRIRKVRK